MLGLLGCSWAAACSDLAIDVRSLTELERAEAKWSRYGPESYAYGVARSCFCPVEAIGPVWVSVVGTTVTRTYVDSGDPVPASLAHLFPTVEELFDILREAYAADADEIRVTYEQDLGYPAELWIDYDRTTADEELGMTVTEEPRPISIVSVSTPGR
jgi:hypothetical protein